MKIILVYRATQFSPHSVKKDMLILEAVGHLLDDGHNVVEYRQEEDLVDEERADLFLSMGRLPETAPVFLTHMARTLHAPQAQLEAQTEAPFVVCYDGLEAVL